MTDTQIILMLLKFFIGFCAGMLVANLFIYLAKLAGWSDDNGPR